MHKIQKVLPSPAKTRLFAVNIILSFIDDKKCVILSSMNDKNTLEHAIKALAHIGVIWESMPKKCNAPAANGMQTSLSQYFFKTSPNSIIFFVFGEVLSKRTKFILSYKIRTVNFTILYLH